MGNHKKIAEYVDACKQLGITVLPPDVNESDLTFTPVNVKSERSDSVEQRKAIRFGLAAIKNVGLQAIDAIQRIRAEKPFESLLDFCQRIDLRVCNKRVIEALIASGAMDSLPGHRAQKISILDETLEAAAKWRKEKEDLQLHLFGFHEQMNWSVEFPDVPPYPTAKQLEMEREMLGLYLSGHPLDPHMSKLKQYDPVPLHLLAEMTEGSWVNVAGLVIACKPIVTRKGKAMAFIELEDRIDQVEVVLFPEVWSKYRELVQNMTVLLVRARVQHDEQRETVKLIADQLYTVHDLPDKIQRLFIKIREDMEQVSRLQQLKQCLQSHKGPMQVILYYERTKKSVVLSEEYQIRPTPQLMEQIEGLLGAGTVKIR